MMIRTAALVIGMFISLCGHAAVEAYEFSSDANRQTYQELVEVLRCPMCQNQNIADSDAMISHDMRRKVYQMVEAGQSKDAVLTYMKSRYGDFVYYQPPVNATTIWLWLLPVVAVVVGVVMVLWRQRHHQHAQAIQRRAEMLDQADKLLKEDK